METKTLVREPLVEHELLVAVFSQFSKQKRPFYFEKGKGLELAFYKASTNSKYSPFFTNYGFDPDALEPYSQGIFDGMGMLKQSFMMYEIEERGMVYYQLSRESIDLYFNKFSSKLSYKGRLVLKEMAKEIEAEVTYAKIVFA